MPVDTRGIVKSSPGEKFFTCSNSGCGREFHHQGYGPHKRYCDERTVVERRAYVESHRTRTWRPLRGKVETMLPAILQAHTTPGIPKKNFAGYAGEAFLLDPADQEKKKGRVYFTVTVPQREFQEKVKKLFLSKNMSFEFIRN